MSVQACAELVYEGDPDRFAAAMTAPVADREVLLPLYAFNLEIARAPWVTAEPLIAEMRLQFWRDVLDEVEAGKPPRAHEVAQPLAEAIQARDIPLEPLRAMIDARRMDIERLPFVGTEGLWDYVDRGAGNLMVASVAALGGDAQDNARELGRVQGVAAWLVATPELRARGWTGLADAAHEELVEEALTRLARIPARAFGPATPAARIAWLTKRILKQAKADPAATFEGRLGGSEFARRGALLFKTLTGRW